VTAGQPGKSEASTPARKRSLLRDIAIQIALVLAILVVFEIALRVVDLRFLREGQRPGYSIAYNYDAELGWYPIPNSTATFIGQRTITIAHNSLGLRDSEPERTRKQTILFFGDSFVWGYDVEANERFTERLRQELPDQAIVNAGVAGYGTDQQYLLLQRLWDRIKPDVVVLIYCVDNDRRDNRSNARYDGYYKPYLAKASDGTWRFHGQPVPKSRHRYFIENPVARHSWVARVAVSVYVQVRHPRVEHEDPTERLVGMMRDLVQQRGARFIVGLQRHEPQLESFLKAQSIPHVSFDGAEHYHGDGDHWTPAGHAFVAAQLKELFVQTGIAN
jgi:heme/copper-type cytochrome/quinol oxidase subunit 2